MTQEEIFHLQAEIQRLQKENDRLKVYSVVPPEKIVERAPSELKVDPIFEKLRDQQQQLTNANLMFAKVKELSQQSEKALSALIPALEVQFHGMKNEIEQLKTAHLETENAYVSVVEKLEAQIRDFKQQWQQQEVDFAFRMKKMEIRQNEISRELQESQALNENYLSELKALRTEAEAPEDKSNPFTSLSIFDL